MSQNTAIVSKLLTGVSNGLFPGAEAYLCERTFPTLDVMQTSGIIGKYGAAHLRIEQDFSGGRSAARRVEPVVRSSTAYLLEKHSLEGMVVEEDYANVEDPFDAEQDETIAVSSLILTNKEYSLASALVDTSVMTQNTTLSGSSQWDNINSSPLTDNKTALAAIKSGSGMVANVGICSWEVANVLRYQPEILDQLGFKQNRPGGLSYDEIAMALGLKKLLVSSASYNSAKEGQTDSLAPIWGKHFIWAYLPESAATRQKSLGYYVRKKGVGSRRVSTYMPGNPANAKCILVDDFYDYVLTDVLCGYVAKSVIA